MHRALVSLTALALFCVPHAAFADDAVGVVEAVDYETGMIFLADGQAFIADETVHVEEVPVGEPVRVAFETSGEDNFAFGFEVLR